MQCPNEGTIQAFIDKELNPSEMKELEIHLFQCNRCKETYRNLSTINSFVFNKIQDYTEYSDNNYIKSQEVYKEKVKVKRGVFEIMKSYKKIISATCAVVVLTTCIAVKPIRAAISNAVSIFRAEDIKGINVSIDDMKKLQEGLQSQNANIDIDKIGNVKHEGGELKTVTIDEAKELVPFKITFPNNLEKKNIENVSITTPSKIDFTMNIDNVNEIMTSLGGKKLFPKNLDGKTFSINFKGTANIDYLDKINNKNIYITQSISPEIIAPSETNVDEIFNAISDLSILPIELQNQLKSIKDWKNILYIPNFNNELEELSVDGIKVFGYFNENEGGAYSNIIYLKDGVITSISANMNKNEIIELVKSMR